MSARQEQTAEGRFWGQGWGWDADHWLFKVLEVCTVLLFDITADAKI